MYSSANASSSSQKYFSARHTEAWLIANHKWLFLKTTTWCIGHIKFKFKANNVHLSPLYSLVRDLLLEQGLWALWSEYTASPAVLLVCFLRECISLPLLSSFRFLGRTNIPFFGGHSKYFTPFTVPSFFPWLVSSSSPTQVPGANSVGPI